MMDPEPESGILNRVVVSWDHLRDPSGAQWQGCEMEDGNVGDGTVPNPSRFNEQH